MRLVLRPLITIACLVVVAPARAEVELPPPTELPATLSLHDALEIFRRHGLDLLIAEAATESAEGAVLAAGSVPNPTLSASVGNAFTYSTSAFSQADCLRNGAVCSPWAWNIGISDSAAIGDALSGKRDLRLRVARNALAAAKLSRRDAERTLVLQVKSTYVQVAQATLAFKFAQDVAAAQATTLKKFHDRWSHGAINEGDLQRIEVQKLEADQAADSAWQALRQARVALAFLLGVRGAVPDFDVDTAVLDYAVPAALRDDDEAQLLRMAFDQRPDLVGLGYQRQQARAQLALTERQQIPDVTLGLNYAWGGFGGLSTNGPIQGQELTLSLSFPLPVFYNLEGERRQAHAQVATTTLQEAKVSAQVASDVASAHAALRAARRLVERMEGPRRDGGGLLASARGAFVTIEAQYDKGAANLTDYLDALRTYIATKNEYFGDLTGYWNAIFELEAAVGRDLR
jgi:cobalt-zinc-cadmium efflux system outer membrane protein